MTKTKSGMVSALIISVERAFHVICKLGALPVTRKAREALGDLAWAGIDLGLDATPTTFTGYENTKDSGTILALVRDGEVCSELLEGNTGIVVLDRTPFYAEMGGQVADHGEIRTATGTFTVTDVQKDKSGKFLHSGVVSAGSMTVEQAAEAEIDVDRRRAIMRAHSATHLLHAALREVLGDHVHQAGSLVEPDRLRFDFTHFSAVSAQELRRVNEIVCDAILDGHPVTVKEMPIDEARATGAAALFGEKYGDIVRVVDMDGASTELCGGTHLDNTAKVGPLRILSESSVASGVRRIEAVTGKVCLACADDEHSELLRVCEILKTKPNALLDKAESQMSEMKSLRQSIERMQDKLIAGDVDRFLFAAKNISGFHVVTTTRTDLGPNDLRKMGDFLRDKDPKVVAVLATVAGEKVTFVAVCGKEAVAAGIKAGDLVRTVSAVAGGKGGGKPDSAMGGGTEVLKTDDALAVVDDFVAEKVGA